MATATGMATVMAMMAMAMAMAMATARADPELTTDYAAPEGGAGPDSRYFTYRGMRAALAAAALAAMANGTATAGGVRATRAAADTFGALKGSGLSAAALDFAPDSVSGPHTHPRASELLLVLRGSLHVGLVDSSSRFFNQTLHRGDLFVFPRGLPHYAANANASLPALAFSAFSSSSPGTVSLAAALFGAPLPAAVLARAFRVPPSVVDQLKAPFAPPPSPSSSSSPSSKPNN